MATVALVALLAGIGTASYSTLRNSSGSSAAPVVLAAAQLEVRRQLNADGSVPAGLVTSLEALTGPPTFTAQAATVSGDVSVYRAGDRVVVLAATFRSGCLVLVDRTSGGSTWVYDSAAGGSCSASSLATAALALPPGGSATAPQELGNG